MKKFKDSTGFEWELSLPFGDVVRVKAESSGKFDLLDPVAGKLAQRLDADILEFWELLAYLVSPQLEAAGVTVVDFGRRMAADCLIVAQQVFFAEWQDFFRLLQRPEMAKALEKIAAARQVAIRLVNVKLKENEPKLDRLMATTEVQLEQALMKSFSDLPETFDSTPSDTPGENSISETKESAEKVASDY